MNQHDAPTGVRGFGRRHLFQLGGLTAAGAVLAACSKPDADSLGRVGLAPTTTDLPTAVVDDSVYLRTAASMERTITNVYDRILADSALLDTANRAAAQRFRNDHFAHSLAFDLLSIEAGGQAYTAPNPRLEKTVVAPVFDLIKGAPPRTPGGPATPPSDDPKRDALNFLWALETIAAQSYQSFIRLLTRPQLRSGTIEAAVASARRSAVLAIITTGRPDGYVAPTALPSAAAATTTTTVAATTTTQNIAGSAPTTTVAATPSTPIPKNYAITTQFGQLSALQLVVGAPNESGTRTTIILDTPSSNTFVYAFMEPGEG